MPNPDTTGVFLVCRSVFVLALAGAGIAAIAANRKIKRSQRKLMDILDKGSVGRKEHHS